SYSGKLGKGRIDAYQTMLQVSPPPTNNTTDSTISKFYNFPNPVSNALTNQSYTSLYVLLTAIPTDIKITIYSLSGRKTKTFNKSDFPLSVTTYTGEGAVVWYLADENNNVVPPGIYIALLEVTDSSGKVQRKYHKVVVQ
ncbi:MAG: hypothetical protein PHV30_08860, partial [Candidatus Margulisbacteria bacterium]|nr:hypothetical protein [Candidatus Margulisiibacteriota bacterium]